MARSTGLDPGEFEIKAVELDGSYRKTRLTKVTLERVGETGDGESGTGLRADVMAEAVRHGLKEAGIGPDSVTLGYPCREAVLRTVDVPFTGRDAIRKVIKAEVEGAIHSHSVDDMVVDFFEVARDDHGTRVMVAAVPKAGLRVVLDAYERVGLEPDVVDLDAIALYRVAHWCGAFADDAIAAGSAEGADDDADEVESLPAVPDVVGSAVRAVIDLGSRSTRVLLVVGGHLTEVRTLRVGDAAIVEQIAGTYGLPLDVARDAVHDCLATGQDHSVSFEDSELPNLTDDGGADAETSPEAMSPAGSITVHNQTVEQARDRFVHRLQNELVRFLASVTKLGAIEAVWITGGASGLPGVRPMLQEVFGREPRELDVMGQLSHNLEDEEAARLNPQLAVAVGLALGRFGGPAVFNFRQEDLAYTRGFDRIKFPLAIASMIALFLVVVFAVKSLHELKCLRTQSGETYYGDVRGPAKFQFYGQVGALMNQVKGGWFADERNFSRQDYRKLYGDLEKTPVFERLELVHGRLRRFLTAKQKDLGIYEDMHVESGLAVLVRLSEILEQKKDQLGRYLLVKLDVNTGKNGTLGLKVAFRGEDFRTRKGILERALKEACDARIWPDTPFESFDERAARVEQFRDSEESGILGAYYDFVLRLKESFAPFPVSDPRVGAVAPRGNGEASQLRAAQLGSAREEDR